MKIMALENQEVGSYAYPSNTVIQDMIKMREHHDLNISIIVNIASCDVTN